MSSILKALEKVEDAHNTRRVGGVGGLARGRERRPAWVVPVWVLAGAGGAALLTFTAMGGFSHKTKLAVQPGTVVTPAPLAANVKPAPLAAAAKPAPAASLPAAQTVDEAPVVPERAVVLLKPAPRIKLKAPSAAAALPVKSGPVPAISAARPASALVQPAAVHPVQAQSVPEKAAPAAVTAPVAENERPEIRVTGIAWQKDAASSAAIVNGRSVQRGGVVEGYKVLEIFEDKVRFSRGDGNLDIPLGGAQ